MDSGIGLAQPLNFAERIIGLFRLILSHRCQGRIQELRKEGAHCCCRKNRRGKVYYSARSALLGESGGHAPPRKFCNFKPSEIVSGVVLGQKN